ncbi:PepSY-associated TM helix domain-containing protein [Novosphingobium sp. Gsoil 351]|uniref:PepSY-associated TM helix domain-containing protein n=1 Tax=Novosphingobium sp. Gsoil 351 TaxID=2675225 RepID=UPI0018A85EDA|nr:PepSY-associated TM helix domain-containing protein [Novosphingobium sp. Gsoil 351]
MKVAYHPFIPRGLQSADLLKWLKRIHAWSGLWGALFFLGLGLSGVLLNHRQQAKIDTGEPVELAAVELPVAPGAIPDARALGRWAKAELRLPVDAQPARGKPGEKRREGGRFMGREVKTAAPFSQTFAMPGARVTVEYVPGSNHVTARREEVNALGVLKNLHKGVGLPIAWVLLIDTIAGALIVMALTGFLLWSRLHGPRLLAGALAGGSLAWALAAAVPTFG